MITDTAGRFAYAEHVTRERAAGRRGAEGGVRRGLLAGAALLVGCATAGPLAERMPTELPDVTLAGWEKYEGTAHIPKASVVYALYVNPVRPALYEVTRYQLTISSTDAEGRTRGHRETEKVLWNSAPGTRTPLRGFEWIARRTWRTLWLVRKGEWRPMQPGTPAYRSAMDTAIAVYAARNQGTR